MRKSWGIVAALSGVALAIPGAAIAAEQVPTAPSGQQVANPTTQTGSTPAPEGHAHAVAAQVDGIVAAGETDAKAGPDNGSATGNGLTVGGKPPAHQFGGTVDGLDKSDKDALLDTGDTPLGRLAVTPWEASTKSGTCRTANARAAVARLVLINKDTLDVNVLQSESTANHCGLTSSGAGSSDGATIDLGGKGGLLLTLLHSESDSSGKGKTYLVSVNGNEIANNDQVNPDATKPSCAIQIPGLLDLTCLTVGGGNGTVVSDVGTLTLGNGQFTGTVVGSSGAGSPTAAAKVSPETITNNGGANAAPAAGNNRGGALAKTGGEIAGITLLGAALVLFGEALRRRGGRLIRA